MACQSYRVTKQDLIDMLKRYEPDDIVGYVFSAQDGKEGECHQILVFYKSTERLV